ncbi:MAG: hypothetical protein V4501_11605 [Pseudomonadota bacterium]
MKKIALFLIGCCLMIALPAQASVELKDLEVAVRALGFTNNPPTGKLNIGIVYSPNVSSSVQEAENLQKLLGGGLQVGNLFLKPIMIKINEADNADVGLFFLTQGVGIDGRKLLPASNKKPIVCITTDISQVIAGACVLGVKSHPKVEILVNRAAAAKSGTKFATAFNMMITEY